ncbi:MAG: dihydroneopterin aldolase [Ilyomonas sp.]
MLTIELSNLRFHAMHGLYAEEKVLGGDYEVNLTIKHEAQKIPVLHLDETIDYTSVYQLVKESMQHPTPLLETVVTSIVKKLFAKFSHAQEINLSIKKLHPPIIAFEGAVGVSFNCKRSEIEF